MNVGRLRACRLTASCQRKVRGASFLEASHSKKNRDDIAATAPSTLSGLGFRSRETLNLTGSGNSVTNLGRGWISKSAWTLPLPQPRIYMDGKNSPKLHRPAFSIHINMVSVLVCKPIIVSRLQPQQCRSVPLTLITVKLRQVPSFRRRLRVCRPPNPKPQTPKP